MRYWPTSQNAGSSFKCFGIVPEIDLKIMKKGQDLFDVTTAIMTAMKDVF